MQELDSSQNDTEFQLKSPNWAGGDSRGPESAIHASTGPSAFSTDNHNSKTQPGKGQNQMAAAPE